LRVLGQQHPYTQNTLENLTDVYAKTGGAAEGFDAWLAEQLGGEMA
jgi:hypothetical protein